MDTSVSSSQQLCKRCSDWTFPGTFRPSGALYECVTEISADQQPIYGFQMPLSTFNITNCTFCTFLKRLFVAHSEKVKLTDLVVSLCPTEYGKYSPSRTTPHSDRKYIRRLNIRGELKGHTSGVWSPWFLEHEVQICDDQPLCGRLIKNEIDMSLIKQWLRLCESHEKCKVQSNPGKLRMIDVIDECLCYTTESTYAAFSYVWGPPSVTQLKLTQTTQASLFTPGGIRHAPRTIRDAVKVCRTLGIRYLWVDAIYIFQDATNFHEFNEMGRIYEGAHITIVSASGADSWAPLPGVDSNTRKINQHVEVIEGLQLSTTLPSFEIAMKGAIWLTRGWTLQESVLSTRLLIFTETQVFFQCNTNLWREDTMLETSEGEALQRANIYTAERGKLSLMDCDYLRGYISLVQDYTRRQLTYQSDILRAFSGIFQRLGTLLKTELFASLPEHYFDYCLIFKVKFPETSDTCELERRPGFPSWSWIGWVTTDAKIHFNNKSVGNFKSAVTWFRIKGNEFQQISNLGIKGAQDLSVESVPHFHFPLGLKKSEIDNLLIFQTESAFLHVSSKPSRMAREEFSVKFPMGFGTIHLHPGWRRTKGQDFWFILIAVEKDEGNSHIMLIETDKRRISTRIQLMQISSEVWESAWPSRRSFFLM